ncbi:esterase-like activity of phytase family protein [Gloeocapsa sp. PCC 73106]|uniref:esterase-like activity of phytase family protein n=1 Tax=Gloeocapsa sp. PCC 73106 TaxID=102232 RepID=UPI0002ABC0FA|nr:esterase-like activity of phytase family protein [Gloeocapsa sp. PCC 73106]ELR98903.1 hypothetical protein GLO73106DRAFT_00027420 [Gloeocapsa sp. PCC 73106]
MTDQSTIRLATYNAALNRSSAGRILIDLASGEQQQLKNVAEIIQRVNPDILLINEIDYIAEDPLAAPQLFLENYLEVPQNPEVDPVSYPYIYIAPVNTGIASGFDLDRDGRIVTIPETDGFGNDAWGFGNFPGQFGMLLYSKYPIVEEQVRTFQNFLWKDMEGARLPDNPDTPQPEDWYSEEILEQFPLSSKSHWDIPINVNGTIVHVLSSHPTPPVFDGPEDRNGLRNSDEIRFWADYVTPGAGDYIYDDQGNFGGLDPDAHFAIMGDQNADPYDGDSTAPAILQLLDNPHIQSDTDDPSITPSSLGGVEAAQRQGGANLTHIGNPAFDTADFNDNSPGNLRADYLLPSLNLNIDGDNKGVFWLEESDPNFERLIGDFDPNLDREQFPEGFLSSDHLLVYMNFLIPDSETSLTFLGEATFAPDTQFANTLVGGLSSITYNEEAEVYYTISDDPSQRNDARFYTLDIDLSDGVLNQGDVSFTEVTTLLDENGQPYGEGSLDPEGLAYNFIDNTLFFSSEGFAQPNNVVNPFVKEIALTGEQIEELELSTKFFPSFAGENQLSGVRNNKGLESLSLTPDGETLFTATEDTIVQDGSEASLESPGRARIIQYDRPSLTPQSEFIYPVNAIAEPANPADAFKVSGLVELLAIDEQNLLSLERSFSVGGTAGEGTGFTILLHHISLDGATNVIDAESIDGMEVTPVEKRLLLDFNDLNIPIDNVEGMTLGPVLPNGQKSLILVADNDFSETRSTQFLLFGLDLDLTSSETPATIFGTPEADSFDSEVPDNTGFTGTQQILLTGSGNDSVDVSLAPGSNRLDLGSDNDLLFAGTNNRILAGSGDDTIFLGSGGGNNVVTGGNGSDQFWLVTDVEDLPIQANIITDFVSGEDVLGFANTDLSLTELNLTETVVNGQSQVTIEGLGRDLAILTNNSLNDLSPADFVFA